MSRYGAKRYFLPNNPQGKQRIRAFVKRPFCGYCGVRLTLDVGRTNTCTVDHIIPLSKGGSGKAYNKTLACRGCNSSKKDSLNWVAPMFTIHEILTGKKATHQVRKSKIDVHVLCIQEEMSLLNG